MKSRFFTEKQPDLSFEWNNANQSDWRVIRRNFVAAYICAYTDRSFDELMFKSELIQEATEKWDATYQLFLVRGMTIITKKIVQPLQFYLHHLDKPLEFECGELEKHLLNQTYNISKIKEKFIKLMMLKTYFENEFEEEKHKIDSKFKKIDYLVTRCHERPIAFFVCELNYKSANVYLRFVTMEPAFHRMGLGKIILNQVQKRFPEAIGMELYTRKANYSAQSFYKNCGFQEYKQFYFGKPSLFLEKTQALYFPDDESTNQLDAFVAFKKNRF